MFSIAKVEFERFKQSGNKKALQRSPCLKEWKFDLKWKRLSIVVVVVVVAGDADADAVVGWEMQH